MIEQQDIDRLAVEWRRLKNKEDDARRQRRECEDQIAMLAGAQEGQTGTKNADTGIYKVRISGKVSTTVDGDKLQQVAADNGLTDSLRHLFRWKPSIDKTEWDKAPESVKRPLLQAMTTKAGRSSFTIEPKES